MISHVWWFFLLISKYLPFLLDKHWSILFVWILNSNTYLFCSNANLNPYIFVFNLSQFIPFQPHLNTPSSFIIHKYLLNSFYPPPWSTLIWLPLDPLMLNITSEKRTHVGILSGILYILIHVWFRIPVTNFIMHSSCFLFILKISLPAIVI